MPTGQEIADAKKLLADLEAHQDEVFGRAGPYKEHQCTVIAAQEVSGWLYAAARSDEVRRTFAKVKKQAAWYFTDDFKFPLPPCLA